MKANVGMVMIDGEVYIYRGRVFIAVDEAARAITQTTLLSRVAVLC